MVVWWEGGRKGKKERGNGEERGGALGVVMEEIGGKRKEGEDVRLSGTRQRPGSRCRWAG